MKPDYHRAKAAATQLLLGQRLRSLRVDVTKLSYKQTILFDTMSHFCSITCTTLDHLCGKNSDFLQDGCTFVRHKNGGVFYIVLYNQNKNPKRQQFTLAHEVGHILLEHETDGDIQESEANCFAAQLLAPQILVHALAKRLVHSLLPQDLCSIFSLSVQAAENRLLELSRSVPPQFTAEDQALLAKCAHLLPDHDSPIIDI